MGKAANTTSVLEFRKNALLPILFGEHNSHLQHLEKKLGIDISSRGNQITLAGDKTSVKTAENILYSLWDAIQSKRDVGIAEIDAELRFQKDSDDNTRLGKMAGKLGHKSKDKPSMHDESLVIKTKKKTIIPRSPNQGVYIKAIQDHEMVFGLGPAGTGKTYLAVAMAVEQFLNGTVERLIFCRPAVEAGERLGFLPGDMKEKVDPYLRPIYDAMHDMMPWDMIEKKMDLGEIEVAPLAFMRGRTLSNAFVILDEAQNTTTAQMKMLLTRIGERSRMVINGDLTQTDLPIGVKSGLRDAYETLDGIDDIAFVHFKKEDVIRHHLVSKIVNAYESK